jgi:hypothetical protein
MLLDCGCCAPFLTCEQAVCWGTACGCQGSRDGSVKLIDHTNNGICNSFIPGARRPATVTNILTAPRIELRPFKCKLKMARSTLEPECCTLNGGYAVHPVPAPCSTRVDKSKRSRAGGFSQKLMLFRRGKAIIFVILELFMLQFLLLLVRWSR